MANSVDPDQTPQNAASDQDLHCLLRPACQHFGFLRYQRQYIYVYNNYKLVVTCETISFIMYAQWTQIRLCKRSVWFVSSLGAYRIPVSLAFHWAIAETDQTAHIHRLSWVFADTLKLCPVVFRPQGLVGLEFNGPVNTIYDMSSRANVRAITKTRLYNFDPLKPHFYIIKLGFTGVYIIFLILLNEHRLWVLVWTASPRRF